jgi:hypothetical protein
VTNEYPHQQKLPPTPSFSPLTTKVVFLIQLKNENDYFSLLLFISSTIILKLKWLRPYFCMFCFKLLGL